MKLLRKTPKLKLKLYFEAMKVWLVNDFLVLRTMLFINITSIINLASKNGTDFQMLGSAF